MPNWDPVEPEEGARRAARAGYDDDVTSKGASAPKNEVDPIRHLSAPRRPGAAIREGRHYLNVTPSKNDGTTVYKLNVKDVPVDASGRSASTTPKAISRKRPYNAYSLNNITAKKSADGSVAIQFGGCDGKIPNCLPIMKGWNYTVRLYRPRAEILNGKWKFPEPSQQTERE